MQGNVQLIFIIRKRRIAASSSRVLVGVRGGRPVEEEGGGGGLVGERPVEVQQSSTRGFRRSAVEDKSRVQ